MIKILKSMIDLVCSFIQLIRSFILFILFNPLQYRALCGTRTFKIEIISYSITEFIVEMTIFRIEYSSEGATVFCYIRPTYQDSRYLQKTFFLNLNKENTSIHSTFSSPLLPNLSLLHRRALSSSLTLGYLGT